MGCWGFFQSPKKERSSLPCSPKTSNDLALGSAVEEIKFPRTVDLQQGYYLKPEASLASSSNLPRGACLPHTPHNACSWSQSQTAMFSWEKLAQAQRWHLLACLHPYS